jgi:glucose/arabinose dehydrogenase
MSLLFYTGSAFPARYRDGAFIAFHGSWNRSPEPQAGFRVVFQPLSGATSAGDFETFADGFTGSPGAPADTGTSGETTARHRPVGLAQAPDGSIYITDDVGGRVWKVTYGGRR